jgi:hypothetical protein
MSKSFTDFTHKR